MSSTNRRSERTIMASRFKAECLAMPRQSIARVGPLDMGSGSWPTMGGVTLIAEADDAG